MISKYSARGEFMSNVAVIKINILKLNLFNFPTQKLKRVNSSSDLRRTGKFLIYQREEQFKLYKNYSKLKKIINFRNSCIYYIRIFWPIYIGSARGPKNDGRSVAFQMGTIRNLRKVSECMRSDSAAAHRDS